MDCIQPVASQIWDPMVQNIISLIHSPIILTILSPTTTEEGEVTMLEGVTMLEEGEAIIL